MGCDIHTVVEKRFKGSWVAVEINPDSSRYRNYRRFTLLAGVRGDEGEGPAPRGLPDDASDTAQMLSEEWGADGHSHSWLPLEEATELYVASEQDILGPVDSADPISYYFNISDPGTDEYRLVFWFDN